MKKILAVLLATSSVAVFADTFQDFNNNLYAQYGLLSNLETNSQVNGFGIGGTFQSKNNVWLNASMGSYNGINGADAGSMFGLKVGYAFQFFGNDDSGFQVIPYASFAAQDNNNYAWGLGVQPEYRLLSSLKASLGLGLQGANGSGVQTLTGSAAAPGADPSATVFGFNVNPEVQYDIAKTIMVSVGYNYVSTFNSDQSVNANSVYAKVGYLF